MRQVTKDQAKATDPSKRQTATDSKPKKQSVPAHVEAQTDQVPAALAKIELLSNLSLLQETNVLVARLKQNEDRVRAQQAHRFRVSDTVKYHLDDLEMLVYLLRLKFQQEAAQGHTISDIFARYRRRGQPFLQPLEFYQMVREMRPDLGKLDKHIDCLYFICRSSLFRGVSMTRLSKVLRLTTGIDVLSLKVRLTVNAARRPSLRLALLSTFQRNDLEGERTLPYGTVRRILTESGLVLTNQEYEFLVGRKLITYKHSDQYVFYREMLELAFQQNTVFRNFVLGVFATIMAKAIRSKKRVIKKQLAADKSSGAQTGKTLKTLRQTLNMQDFVKKASVKNRQLKLQTSIAQSILNEIINAVPMLATDKTEEDLNVIKDVIVPDRLSESQQSDLIPRAFASAQYGRGILLDKDLNLIQYDLPTGSQLPKVSLRSNCPVPPEKVLDVLVSANDCLFLLTQDWQLWIWELTGSTYKTRINLKCSPSVEISRYYKTERLGGVLPRFLSESERYVLVNHTFCDSSVTFVDKSLLIVERTVRMGKRHIGMTPDLLQRGIEFHDFLEQAKVKGRRIFPSSLITKEELSDLFVREFAGDWSSLVDYLVPERDVFNEDLEMKMDLLLSRHNSVSYHLQEKVYRLVALLRNHYDAERDGQESNLSFDLEGLRRMLLTVDRRITPNEASEFWYYLDFHRIRSFKALKEHCRGLKMDRIESRRFHESFLLIFERCLQCGIAVREELARLDRNRSVTISRCDLRQLLLKLPIGLTPSEVGQLLDSAVYTRQGEIEYDGLLNHPQLATAQQKSMQAYQPASNQPDQYSLLLLPEICLEELVYLEPIETLVYTMAYPRHPTIFASAVCRNQHRRCDSTFLVAEMKHYTTSIPPLIKYEPSSGFLLSAGRAEGQPADLCLWDLRFKEVLNLTSPIRMEPTKVIKNAHKNGIVAMCYMPYTQIVITSCLDASIKLWDPISESRRAKKQKVRLAAGYYSYLNEEMLTTSFVEAKRLLLRQVCYSLVPVTLRYQLPQSFTNQATELCLMSFSVPKTHYQTSSTSLFCVYSLSRLKIEIKESRWQDQLPHKLNQMLEEMARSRCRRMINFKVSTKPVAQLMSPLEQLYSQLLELNHICIPFEGFLKKVMELLEKRGKSKVSIAAAEASARDTDSVIEQQLGTLVNCREALKRLITDRERQRRLVLLNLHTTSSPREMSLAEFTQCLSSAGIVCKQMLLEEIFEYYCHSTVSRKALSVKTIAEGLFSERELLSWERFQYNLAQAKSVLLYRGQLQHVDDTRSFLTLARDSETLSDRRLEFLEQYLLNVEYAKVRLLFARLPIEYQIVVPRFHQQLSAELKLALEELKNPSHKHPASKEFTRFLQVCGFNEEPLEQTMHHLAKELIPTQAHKDMTFSKLASYLQSQRPELQTRLQRLCENSEAEIELPLFINYVCFNTDLNRGSLLPLAFQDHADFDYLELFKENAFAEEANGPAHDTTIGKMVMALKLLRKPVALDKLFEGYREGPKIHVSSFQKWLRSMDCSISEQEALNFFNGFLKGNSLGFAAVAELQHAIELGYSRLSCFYNAKVWSQVFSYYGTDNVNDFKSCIPHIRRQLSLVGNRAAIVSGRDFFQNASKLYRSKKAELFTKMASIGSLNNAEVAAALLRDPTYKLDDGYVHVEHLAQALHLFRPKQNYEELPVLKLRADVMLPRLPRTTHTIAVADLPRYLAYNDKHLPASQVSDIQQRFRRRCGEHVPIEWLLPASSELDGECCRHVGHRIVVNGDSLEELFELADEDRTGILTEDGCSKALQHVCSAFEARLLTRLIDFNREQVTREVFRQRMELLVVRPTLAQLKRAFLYKLTVESKLHLLQNVSQLDVNRTGRVGFEALEKLVSRKGRALHALLLYNWSSQRYIGQKEARTTELQYERVVQDVQRDIVAWMPAMLAYQDRLRDFLTRQLMELDLTLFEVYRVHTLSTAGMLTPRAWQNILTTLQPKPDQFVWYFLEREVCYLKLCEHMKAVTPELAATSDSLSIFAQLIHKKSSYYEVFRFMDLDGSGKVNLGEFVSHCTNMRIGLPADTVKEIFLQLSQSQREFTYDQLVVGLQPFALQSDRNDWIFAYKRAVENELIQVPEELLHNEDKLYALLASVDCQKFLNVCHGCSPKQVQAILESVDCTGMLLEKFEAALLANNRKKDISDRKLFDKLALNYLSGLSLTKRECAQLWEAYLVARTHSMRTAADSLLRSPETVQIELNVTKILKAVKEGAALDALDKLGLNRFSKITKENLKELLEMLGIVMSNREVEGALAHLNKTTYRELLAEASPSDHMDLTEDSSSTLLSQIKQSLRDLCQRLNITSKDLFRSFVKNNADTEIREKYWVPLFVFTLRLKVQHARSLYYYLDDDRNGEVSEEEWCRKFAADQQSRSGLARSELLRMLDIHHNGYLRPSELEELLEPIAALISDSPAPSTTSLGLVCLSQWVRESTASNSNASEGLNLKQIQNVDKLIECLVQQSTSVYSREEGLVAEAVSSHTDGITIKGLAKAFKLAEITLTQADKSYFSSFFAVKFNPSFLDLKRLLSFVRMFSKRPVVEEDYSPMNKLVRILEQRKSNPRDMFKKASDAARRISRSQMIGFLRRNGLQQVQDALCMMLLQAGGPTSEEEFMARFNENYIGASNSTTRTMVRNIDRAPVGLYDIISNVFAKLSEKYAGCDQFWQALSLKNELLTKESLQRLLISVGLSDFSEQQISEFFQFLDDNRSGGVTYFEMLAFWNACETAVRRYTKPSQATKISILREATAQAFSEYIAGKGVRPAKEFVDCDGQRKGYLTLSEFRVFLKKFGVKLADQHKITELMSALDPTAAKGTLSYLPLMARLAKYCDVFGAGAQAPQATRIFDRQLAYLFQQLPLHEIKKFDGDYDSVLDISELLRLIVSRIGRKNTSSSYRLCQFLRDFIGLNTNDLFQYGRQYHEKLGDIQLEGLPPSANTTESIDILKKSFSRTCRIQAWSGRIHQVYRYLTAPEEGGIAMLVRLLQLAQLVPSLECCRLDIEDILNFLSTVVTNRFQQGLYRIPIGDEQLQAHTVDNTSAEALPQAKQLVLSSAQPLNPFLEVVRIKDTDNLVLRPTKQAYGLLCLDSHTLEYHVKLSRDLYDLPICSSKIAHAEQIVITSRDPSFEDTVKKLGGLLFNSCFKDNFGEVAKGWAAQILRLVKRSHEMGLIGLLRPGNLTFNGSGLGFCHMFMALKCNDDGLAKCGIDAQYCNTTEASFPEFTGDLSDPRMQAYLSRIQACSFNAPEMHTAKQLSCLTPAIDIYAFGVLVFVMLFGQEPVGLEHGSTEPSVWSNRRIFDAPLASILSREQLDELWRDTTSTDIGQAICNFVDCSDTNKQSLRDLLNVIQMCLNYEWYRRPTVDNLLSTVFFRVEFAFCEQLLSAEDSYSPELLLAPLRNTLRHLVGLAANQNQSQEAELEQFGRKLDLLKVMQLAVQSMDHPRLLGSIVSEFFLDELLFVVLNYVSTEHTAVQHYPVEVVRSELFEVIEAFLLVLKKLLQKVTPGSPPEFIEHVLTMFAKSYLREPLSLLSEGTAPWLNNYRDDGALYELLVARQEETSFVWNELWFSLASPVYKQMLSNRTVRECLQLAEQAQHINEFELQRKLETLTRQQDLRVPKSLVYYEDLVGVSECLQSLHQSAREDNQSSKSALKIVLGYVKSLVLSHDINKTRALLDSRVGEGLQGLVANRNPEIRQQVMALYRELSLGLLPARMVRRSAEEVHKSLGVLHHFMSTTDRMDRRKFQDFSNDYYGFKAEIVRQILRQVCKCFSLPVLSSALAQWNTDTLNLFANLLHGGEDLLTMLNSPTVEAFQNFYTYWTKLKDEESRRRCQQIHDTILFVNNSRLFHLLQGNPVVMHALQKLQLAGFRQVTLFYLSNRYVLLMNHYNKHSAAIASELEALALSRHDKSAKPTKLTRSEHFRKELLGYLDQTIRFVRDCPRDRMIACSQLLERLSPFLRRLIDELGVFQQLSMNAELIVVRSLSFYEELLREHWEFMFTPQLLGYLLEQLFCAYSYHGRIRESQTQLSIQNMQELQLLQSPEAIVEYVLRHDLLRKFTQNRMSEAANSLMRCFVGALAGELQGRLYGIGFVGSFCRLARWQYSLVLAYMQTKTENLHVLQSYVEEANFRVRVFDLLVREGSARLQSELIKAGFIEFLVQVLLPNQQQFDMRFYRSSEEFLPYRYSIPLRNEALCMITAVFWNRPQCILQELVAQMLKHGTIRTEAANLTHLKPTDMRFLDSLWLFSHLLSSKEPVLLLEADNYSVRQLISRRLQDNPELARFFPVLNHSPM